MTIHTPDWVKHAVFYQIFPDRFARHPGLVEDYETMSPLNLEPWDAPPTPHGYKGGNLRGVTSRLDYLKDLGITAIYFTPIFQSACNHRYHTFDYFQVDPLLGGNEAFFEMLHAAHARGIRVVLDGVFNHTGRGFFQFHDIVENGFQSPWSNWFKVRQFPLNAYADDPKEHPPNYDCWWNLRALPTLNHDNPAVREYIMRVAEHWIRAGIDGWRLDVPEMITAKNFWQEFRQRIKTINPDAYIVGEVWVDARSWLDGEQFDGVMNYLFTKAALSFLGHEHLDRKVLHDNFKDLNLVDAATYARTIENILALYPKEILWTQLNLLNSHDTARFLSTVGINIHIAKLGALLLFTFPGAPCIYYGDEIGLEGHADPDCRRGFPEGKNWKLELLETYKKLIALRHREPVLSTGHYKTLVAKDMLYVFARVCAHNPSDAIIVATNNSASSVEISVPLEHCLPIGKNFSIIYGDGACDTERSSDCQMLRLKIPPFGGVCAK